MNEKKWIISNINTSTIPFDKLFYDRNKYDMSKEEFFKPNIDNQYDGMLMLGMKRALERIDTAIKQNEKIYIYGDYDVDGTSATAILLKTFNILDYHNINYYIPNRKTEGYGLNKDAINKISQDECKLIITVDCGITAIDEVELANELEMDVIITDHHQVGEVIPKAYSIVNPHQKNCKYPYKNLCGAAIAYKLSRELLRIYAKQETGELVEIAGIATVADIMELNGENRVIVKNALREIKKSSNFGIDALITEAGLNKSAIFSYEIGFGIAPRINSAGRLDDASLAVRLYMAKNEIEAKCYAKELNILNYKRQEMVKDIYEKSLVQVEEESEKQPYVTVSYGENWNKGVIGIVASKLVDKFGKPSVVIAIDDDKGSASFRGIENFNFFEVMKSMENMFEKYGGHEMAGGFSIKKEKIPAFIKKINAYAKKIMLDEDYEINFNIDMLMPADAITQENYNKMEMFEPFGIENEKPIFLSTDISLENIQFIGKDKNHFKARDKKTGKNILKFNSYDELKDLDISKNVDIVFHMNRNVFADNVDIQMFASDIRYSYDYSYDYKDIYQIVRDDIGYFEMNYDFSLEDVINFEILELKNISKLIGKTAFLCYSYKSYFYIRKLMEYSYKRLDFYQDNMENSFENMVILLPLLDKTELKDYDNIVVCDKLKKIENVIYECECNKYALDFSQFDIGYEPYDLRLNMVILYNFFKKYGDKNIRISDILNILKMDSMIFFIVSCILQKCKLIDIIYDFQYNKVHIKLKKTDEKQNINDNIIFRKFKQYFSIIGL
ncbi:MAG: single-stranded-DNA-specific exonuclease RecJ [Peptoanaerobacter stomatis]|uniref:single-stranded-DNA-specific exonuclease RecJ n=1 Tax=Peptoanaerobacter stomatis TaxID=796937 RepID=UPI003FA0F54A